MKIFKSISRQFVNTSKVVSLAVVLAVSANVAYAVWSNPTDAPPGSNVSAPINVGASTQTKAGVLGATRFNATNGSWALFALDAASAQNAAAQSEAASLNVNDIYIRSVSQWASQLSSAPAGVLPSTANWRLLVNTSSEVFNWVNPNSYHVEVAANGRQDSGYTNGCGLVVQVDGVSILSIHNANPKYSKSCSSSITVPPGSSLRIVSNPYSGSGGITAYVLE